MAAPRLTVLMPVYNGEAYLGPAIDSILAQTFGDFEFLIIDDGSSDASREIAAGYSDPRIRRLENSRNLGLVATLNRGLAAARGEYIARMDCDDVSYPQRFARQVAFLEQHPKVGLCGTWYTRAAGDETTLMQPPAEDRDIRFMLIFDTVFAHNTILFRRDFLERHHLRYDPAYPYAEDYDLWVRCARHGQLANLPEVLLDYRYHPGNTSHQYRAEQAHTADRIRAVYLHDLGLEPSPEQIALHLDLLHFRFQGGLTELRAAGDWLAGLARVARAWPEVDDHLIDTELARHWYGACGRCAGLGPAVWTVFRDHAFGRRANPAWQAKLWSRCVMKRPIPLEPAP